MPVAAAQQYLWTPANGQPDPEVGPDVPTTPFPVATVVVFDNEQYAWTAGERARTIDVPTGWNRVVMTYNERPEGDPWDRLFVVLFERVEVLRGTTPRTNFTVEKDMTRYASLLPQGGQADVTIDTSSWEIGPQYVTLTLSFYDDITGVLVEPAWDHAVSAYANRGLCQNSVISVPVEFPVASSKGTLEFFATGHGAEEEQFFSRHFDILVDGEPLTSVYVFPYTYAILGFYGGNDAQHPVMWWTGQRALDIAGVHTGPGEIPPYRLQLSAEQLAMLSGASTVEVRAKEVYSCLWITSLSFLLDE
jgi:hypothetical protein